MFVTGFTAVCEVEQAAVIALALPATLGLAVTAADIHMFVVLRKKGLAAC
jgi:hypothetical protein